MDLKVRVVGVLGTLLLDDDAVLSIYSADLNFHLVNRNFSLRLPLSQVGSVVGPVGEGPAQVMIYCTNLRRITLHVPEKDSVAVVQSLVTAAKAGAVPPFQYIHFNTLDKVQNILSQQGAIEKGWKAVSVSGEILCIPTTINDVESLLLHRGNTKVPSYVWGCWDPNSPIYGSFFMSCSRPAFITDQGNFIDYLNENALLYEKDISYIEQLTSIVYENASLRNLKTPNCTYITIMDTGSPNSTLMEAYPNCKFNFLRFNIEEIEKQFMSICDTSSSLSFPDLETCATNLTQLVYRFLQPAYQCIEIFKGGGSVIIELERPEHIFCLTVLSCLVKVMCGPAYRTMEGLFEMLCREWSPLPMTNLWIYYIILLSCVYELMYRHPNHFSIPLDFIRDLIERLQDPVDTLRSYIHSSSPGLTPPGPFYDWDVSAMKYNSAIFFTGIFLSRNIHLVGDHQAVVRGSDQGGVVMVADQKLAYVPRLGKPEKVNELVLRNCLLHSLIGIEKFVNLKKLVLDENYLEADTFNQLQYLKQLEKLSVCKNNSSFATFPKSFKLTSLTELRFASNTITSIDELCSLRALKVLALENNKIAKLPINLSLLSDLEVLILANNMVGHYPSMVIQAQVNLQQLDLSFNRLTIFPNKVGPGHTNLTALNLSHNRLLLLPDSLAHCVNLNQINLTANLLTAFPGPLRSLTKLQKLDVSHNKITEFPNWICGIGIVVMNCEGNQIKSLPTSICLLSELKSLNLGSNLLARLPPSMGYMTNLTTLIVENNNLHSSMDLKEMTTPNILDFLKTKLSHKKNHTRAKLILLGNEKSGKEAVLGIISKHWMKTQTLTTTWSGSFVKSFLYKSSSSTKFSFRKKSTGESSVIIIDTWDIPFEYNLHQLYMSSRAQYLIVFSLIDHKKEDLINNWFSCLQELSIKSKSKFKIYMVGTNLDQVEESKQDELKLFKNQLITKFESLASSFHISFLSNNETDSSNQLRNALEASLGHIKINEVNESWLQFTFILKEACELLQVPILSLKQVIRYGSRLGMSALEVIRCCTFLSKLGMVLYLEQPAQLKEILFLDPSWLASVGYTLFREICKPLCTCSTSLQKFCNEMVYVDEILQLFQKLHILHLVKPKKELLNVYPFCQLPDHPETLQDQVFVPSLLQEDPNFSIESVKQNWTREGFKTVNRIYHFMFFFKSKYSRLQHFILEYANKTFTVTPTCLFVMIQCVQVLAHINLKTQESVQVLSIEVSGPTLSQTNVVFQRINLFIEDKFGDENLKSRFVLSGSTINIKTLKQQIKYSQSPRDPLLGSLLPDFTFPDYTGTRFSNSEIDQNTISEPLGEGGYAIVYLSTLNKEKVAIKKYRTGKKQKGSASTRSEFQKEITIHSLLHNPSIVSLIGISLFPPSLVLEYCPWGTLYDHIHSPTPISAGLRFKFAIDILKGVQYLHGFQPPIAHLDLKSPNVLIYSLDKDATINCKLADFGTAQFVRVPVESKMVENPVWTAPEVLEGVPYDESADTYAVGVILWELVTRMNYFGELGSFLRAIHDKVIEGNRPPIPAFVLPSYASIIQECWAQSPESRPKDWNRIISLIEHMRVQVGEAEVHISTMYPKLTPTPSSTSPRTTPSPKSPTAASPTSSTPKLLGAVRSHSEKREEREEGKKSVNSERVSKVSVKRTQRVPARTASELSMGKWEVTKVVEQRNMIREKSEEFRKDSEKTGSDIPTRRTTMEQTLHFGLSRPKLDGPGSALKKLTKLPFPPEQHEVNMAELPEQEQYRQFVLGLMRSDSSREDPMSSPTVIDSITQIDSPYNTSTSKMASKQKLAKRPRFRHPKISDLVELMVESHTNNSTFNIAVEKQDTERRKSIFNVISSATLRWIYDNSLENMSVRYSKRDGTQKVCAASAWFPPGVSAARMDFQKHLMDAIKHVRKVSSKGALRTKTLFQDIFELTNTMVTSNCWELLFISIIPSCIEFRDVWEDILDKVLSQADKSQQSVLCFTSDQKQMEMLSSFHFSKVKECITCKTATIWALMRPPTPKS